MPVFLKSSQMLHVQKEFINWLNNSKSKHSITSHNALCIKKIFKNAITDHSTPKQAIEDFSRKIHEIKGNFKISKNVEERIIEVAKDIISKADLKKVETDPKTTIFTTHIKNVDMSERIKKIADRWGKNARDRYVKAKKLKLSAAKRELALASMATISGMCREIQSGKTYIAYDARNTVQAIAIAEVSKDEDTEIDYIATNPNNVVIFGNEQPVRGAGTALMKHIALDTVKKNKKGGIYLYAYDSALPFYKKIGFKVPKSGNMSLRDSVLSKDRMESFLKSHKDVGIIKSSVSLKFT